MILGHEDDRPNYENENLYGLPFENYRYSWISIQSLLVDIFLTFKIERPVVWGCEADNRISLTEISDDFVFISDVEVRLDKPKLDYLKIEKAGLMSKADIADLDRVQIQDLVKERLNGNYLYNMTYRAEHNVAIFNINVEVPRSNGGYATRLTVALEYIAASNEVRIVTIH